MAGDLAVEGCGGEEGHGGRGVGGFHSCRGEGEEGHGVVGTSRSGGGLEKRSEEGLTRQQWVVGASGKGQSRERKRWSAGGHTPAQASRGGSAVAALGEA